MTVCNLLDNIFLFWFFNYFQLIGKRCAFGNLIWVNLTIYCDCIFLNLVQKRIWLFSVTVFLLIESIIWFRSGLFSFRVFPVCLCRTFMIINLWWYWFWSGFRLWWNYHLLNLIIIWGLLGLRFCFAVIGYRLFLLYFRYWRKLEFYLLLFMLFLLFLFLWFYGFDFNLNFFLLFRSRF